MSMRQNSFFFDTIMPLKCVSILMYKNFFGLSQFNWETQNEWEKLFYMALEAEDSRCRNSRNKSLEEIICKKIWTFAADLFRIR